VFKGLARYLAAIGLHALSHTLVIHGAASAPQGPDQVNVLLFFFNPHESVIATVWVEKGFYGEVGRAVFFQQGNHRCVLGGCLHGRPVEEEEATEDAIWVALSAWANFEPRLGKKKPHVEALYFPDALTHVIESVWDFLDRLPKSPGFDRLSGFRRQAIPDFSVGFGKLVSAPSLGLVVDAPPSSQSHGLYDWVPISAPRSGPRPFRLRLRGTLARCSVRTGVVTGSGSGGSAPG
jgi:hypothetical protein